jgi:hypothetical protein
MNRRWLLAIFILALSACGKKESAPPAPVVPSSEGLGPYYGRSESERIKWIKSSTKLDDNKKALLLSMVPWDMARDRQEAKDRKELVLPPEPGWKPEDVRRKLKIKLVPEKVFIRKGEKFRYRLEIQNVGRETIYINEFPASFIKTGRLNVALGFEFYVTPPGGKEEHMFGDYGSIDMLGYDEIKFPAHFTEADKEAAVERMNLESKAASQLSLALNPGETLTSRSDRSRSDRFAELGTWYEFDKLGTYKIRAVYGDEPSHPLTEKHIAAMIKRGVPRDHQLKSYREMVRDSLGRVQSNVVTLEVVR